MDKIDLTQSNKEVVEQLIGECTQLTVVEEEGEFFFHPKPYSLAIKLAIYKCQSILTFCPENIRTEKFVPLIERYETFLLKNPEYKKIKEVLEILKGM